MKLAGINAGKEAGLDHDAVRNAIASLGDFKVTAAVLRQKFDARIRNEIEMGVVYSAMLDLLD
jgi:hypothetical protein